MKQLTSYCSTCSKDILYLKQNTKKIIFNQCTFIQTMHIHFSISLKQQLVTEWVHPSWRIIDVVDGLLQHTLAKTIFIWLLKYPTLIPRNIEPRILWVRCWDFIFSKTSFAYCRHFSEKVVPYFIVREIIKKMVYSCSASNLGPVHKNLGRAQKLFFSTLYRGLFLA